MTTTIERMRQKLAVLAPVEMEIGDDSALHAVHAGAKGGGGHYRLKIVAPVFLGKSTVARHRIIYEALGDMMHGEIHALAIQALPTNETYPH